MYKRDLRDFFGTIVDTVASHPFSDGFRAPRLKLWWWRRFRPRKYALLRQINLGCGPAIVRGMCNVDVTGPADLRFNFLNRFPFDEGISDFVYTEHTLEHFHIEHVWHILGELHRVLRAGGVIRINVPRVDPKGASSKSNGRVWPIDDLGGLEMESLNRELFSHEHRTFYSFALLEYMLRKSGFEAVTATKEGESALLRVEQIGALETRHAGSLIVEARKPPR